MLIDALLVALVATGATPSSEPPKTIVHTKTSPFCTAMRENAGRAVAGLLLNDRLIAQGETTLDKISRDVRNAPMESSFGSPFPAGGAVDSALMMDYTRLRDVAQRMAHNLEVVDALLADPRFDARPENADSGTLAKIKEQLLAVKRGQESALNEIGGLAETEETEQFMNQANHSMSMAGDLPLASKLANVFGAGPISDQGRVTGGASRGAVNADPLQNDPALANGNQFTLQGPVAKFYAGLLIEHDASSALESQAAKTIVENAKGC